MKKITVILISVVSVIIFSVLVIYGLRHSRGRPVVYEKPERIILAVPFVDRDIDLSKGISSDLWDKLKPVEITLKHQVMVLPWGEGLVSPIRVKAFHNKKEIFFYISWDDATEDTKLGLNKFSDACAIMFPLEEDVAPSTIMMGFMGRSNIWQWKASQDREYWVRLQTEEVYADYYYPFEEEETFVVMRETPKQAVNDLLSVRVGTITSKDNQIVQGRGIFSQGAWQVVFKRQLNSLDSEIDTEFSHDKNKLCAFAVWNGAVGDRGGRKSISDWVELDIE